LKRCPDPINMARSRGKIQQLTSGVKQNEKFLRKQLRCKLSAPT
jgi:hypothetical protein